MVVKRMVEEKYKCIGKLKNKEREEEEGWSKGG